MKIIDIDDNNLNEILIFKQKDDEIFMNRLWEYAFFSISGKRTAGICPFCNMESGLHYEYENENIETVYERDGIVIPVFYKMMFVLKNEHEIYRLNGRIFHYFFTHKFMPKEHFRGCVMKYSIYDEKYRNIVKSYVTNECEAMYERYDSCEKCQKPLNSRIHFEITKYKGKEIVFSEEETKNKARISATLCVECMHQNLMIIRTDRNTGKLSGERIENL